MRALTLLAAALALSACGKGAQTDNTQNVESLTADNITSNDVTAIDAVTGDDANMAADVDVNFTNAEAAAPENMPASTPPAVRPKPAPKSAGHASEPAGNSATANSL